MKTRSILYLLLLALPLTSSDCLTKKGTPAQPVHETKIIVQLTGEFRDKEVADVIINSGSATTISGSAQATATVAPGTHTIHATTRTLQGSMNHTTEVKDGETKTINLPCERATLTVKPDGLWLGSAEIFEVQVVTQSGFIRKFFVEPGVAGSLTFEPEKNMTIVVLKDRAQPPIMQFDHNFYYQEKLSVTVPF